MAIDWHALWQALNERQQHFMTFLYDTEDAKASVYNSQDAMFHPLKKGAEWRWMAHNPVGGGGLQATLKEKVQYNPRTHTSAEVDDKSLNNQGTGSTYKALEDEGYLERRWDAVEMYSLRYGKRTKHVLSVRLTRKGRKLVRMHMEAEWAKANKAQSTGKAQAMFQRSKASGKSLAVEDEANDEVYPGEHAEREAACNPDGFVDVPLRLGGHAHVAPDAPPELLDALNAIIEAYYQHIKGNPVAGNASTERPDSVASL